jgi:hypothetical protein
MKCFKPIYIISAIQRQQVDAGQDKRLRVFLFLFWAHPCAYGARTGLSACIFFACGKKGYRFNPLRVSGAETWDKILRIHRGGYRVSRIFMSMRLS